MGEKAFPNGSCKRCDAKTNLKSGSCQFEVWTSFPSKKGRILVSCEMRWSVFHLLYHKWLRSGTPFEICGSFASGKGTYWAGLCWHQPPDPTGITGGMALKRLCGFRAANGEAAKHIDQNQILIWNVWHFFFDSSSNESINVDSMVQRWRRRRACCWKDWEVLKPSTSLQRTLVHCAHHLWLSRGKQAYSMSYIVFWLEVRVCKIHQKRTHTPRM